MVGYMGVSTNGESPQWLVDNGKSYLNGMIWMYIPISGNLHISHFLDQQLTPSCRAKSRLCDATVAAGTATVKGDKPL